MITEKEYREAKETVLKYEHQQMKLMPFEEGTLDTPSRWYFARRWKEDGRVEVIYYDPLNPNMVQHRAIVKKEDEKYFKPNN